MCREDMLSSDTDICALDWIRPQLIAVHERVDSRFLVLPGSESTITEITEYIYFSPSKHCSENYKSE